MMLHKHFKGP